MTEPTNQQPAIRVVMMPRDTNPMGTIFGGIILSYIDQAGAVETRKHFGQERSSRWPCTRSSSSRRCSWATW